MNRRCLPNGVLELTELGFGGSQIGNLYRATTDDEAHGAILTAWQAGIRYFDTAPHYGLGLSERRLGKALRCLPRDEIVVSTKIGRLLEPTGRTDEPDPEGFAVQATHRRIRDYSRDGVLRSVEASLERLGLDRIDLVLIHDPDDNADQALGAAAPALSRLRNGALRFSANHSLKISRISGPTGRPTDGKRHDTRPLR